MSEPKPAFKAADVVQRLNQPEAMGVVREARWDEQTESWNYSVQFGAQLKVVPEDLLQGLQAMESAWSALRALSLSGIDHLKFTLTYHRLRRPPARIAYSFATSKTLFYSHQFKPLLKFLDHPGNRILIADDVGLGKTIEAGYIIRELQARQVVQRVLIVVPARLAPKWKREMRNRFNEYFDIVRKNELLKFAERIDSGRQGEDFRWIISYESVRPEEVRAAFNKVRPTVDVLIADEAHRMRNPRSLQHKIGKTLCESADTAVFLSATPVQNKLDDLYYLLHILSPEEFEDKTVFQQQMDSNRSLIHAQRELTSQTVDHGRVLEHLGDFFQTETGHLLDDSAIARSIYERLDKPQMDRRDIVDLQADIARLSPTGHILSRTRKVEAIPGKTERKANWRTVHLTAAERAVYESAEAVTMMAFAGRDLNWGFRMSLLLTYRIVASCIPAALDYFKKRLDLTSDEPLERLIEEQEGKSGAEGSEDGADTWNEESRARMGEAVALREEIESHDSKLNALLEVLRECWEQDDQAGRPRRKVVVFSFFRNTLNYLERALKERNIVNRMIHGKIKVNDRESRIDDFLERDEVRVLLTSDVGGEGIDLQRASVLVNYDLPWNPMVVEQRIGRIDRIGQMSPVINVFHLVVENSVEEKVVQRLLKKIDIYLETVGELDPIIGEKLEKITAKVVSGLIGEEELDAVLEQEQRAIETQVQQAQEVLGRVDGLLAADQGIIDEIKAVTGERQIPAEREVLHFLNQFLASRYVGCQIPASAAKKVAKTSLKGELGRHLEAWGDPTDADVSTFARRISTGPVQLTLSRDAGYRHPGAELLHIHHPLSRFAVAQVEKGEEKPQTAFAVALGNSSVLQPGQYAFLVSVVEIHAHRPRVHFVTTICDVASDRIWLDQEETKTVLLETLDSGTNVELPPGFSMDVEALQRRLTSGVSEITADWENREKKLDVARQEQHRATLLATLKHKRQRAQTRLDGLLAESTSEFAINMARSQVEKVERELQARQEASTQTIWRGIEKEEIAVGILFVGEQKK